MEACPYARNLSDAEWTLLEPLLCCSPPAGRRETYPLKRIVDAIFYPLRTGVQWRMVANAAARVPTSLLSLYHYVKWRQDGTWERVTCAA
jgi:transposase